MVIYRGCYYCCSHHQVPIYLGAVEPLNIGNIVADKRYFHGSDGFGDCLGDDGLEHVPSFVKPQHAVVAIRELCQAQPKQITLIMVGPLTNLALGYTMYGEQFGQDIKDVYIMGGNYQGVGNSSRAAEFNFHSDPEAAHAVLLKTPCPITILPWEPCTKDRFHIPIVSCSQLWSDHTFHSLHLPPPPGLASLRAGQTCCCCESLGHTNADGGGECSVAAARL